MVNNKLLLYFSEHGNCKLVKMLIPVSDPKASDSLALELAAKNGHTECVRLLIPVSDPMANESLALWWAAENGHTECVMLLIPLNYTRIVYVILLLGINILHNLVLRLLSIYLYIKQRQY